ncbi:MAG: SDR family oxidoreductase [Desulfurococcales archaeon]|nr:SDR family oxidoreductase [Desulfurococcales archaeon]
MSWALVTASTRGIGSIAAQALAEKGYNLILTSRTPEKHHNLLESMKKHGAREALLLKLDLTSKESVASFIEEVERLVNGELKVMIINYGNPTCEPCTLSEIEWDDWIEAASMYLASTNELLKLASRMREKVRVIIISSFTTTELHPHLILADTVRRGLDALVKAAAYEYPNKVSPVLLLLGSFKTPGALETIKRIAEEAGVDPDTFWEKEVEARSPLKRVGREEELKSMIKFLAEAPDYLTGSRILFDGASSRSYS